MSLIGLPRELIISELSNHLDVFSGLYLRETCRYFACLLTPNMPKSSYLKIREQFASLVSDPEVSIEHFTYTRNHFQLPPFGHIPLDLLEAAIKLGNYNRFVALWIYRSTYVPIEMNKIIMHIARISVKYRRYRILEYIFSRLNKEHQKRSSVTIFNMIIIDYQNNPSKRAESFTIKLLRGNFMPRNSLISISIKPLNNKISNLIQNKQFETKIIPTDDMITKYMHRGELIRMYSMLCMKRSSVISNFASKMIVQAVKVNRWDLVSIIYKIFGGNQFDIFYESIMQLDKPILDELFHSLDINAENIIVKYKVKIVNNLNLVQDTFYRHYILEVLNQNALLYDTFVSNNIFRTSLTHGLVDVLRYMLENIDLDSLDNILCYIRLNLFTIDSEMIYLMVTYPNVFNPEDTTLALIGDELKILDLEISLLNVMVSKGYRIQVRELKKLASKYGRTDIVKRCER